jgi:hypothetical protein
LTISDKDSKFEEKLLFDKLSYKKAEAYWISFNWILKLSRQETQLPNTTYE